MRIDTLISLCQMYSREGHSIHEQMDDVMEGRDLEELNPNALKIIRAFFERAARADVDGADGLAEMIEDHQATLVVSDNRIYNSSLSQE